MADALRKTGIPLMEDIPWGAHIALFYETKGDLLDTCAGYFAAGLQNNESCVWALADSVTVEDARRVLQDAIPDFDTLRGRRQHRSACRAGNCILPDGEFDLQLLIENWRAKLRHALDRGYEGLRSSGNAWLAASQRRQYFEFLA